MVKRKHMTTGISRTRASRLGLLCALVGAALLSACEKERQPNVWEQYDIRVPVPAHSAVPNSSANYWQYNDPYRVNNAAPGTLAYPVDNDAYYLPPTSDINSETYD